MKRTFSCINEIITIQVLDSFHWSKRCYEIVIWRNQTVIFCDSVIQGFFKLIFSNGYRFYVKFWTASQQLTAQESELLASHCLETIIAFQIKIRNPDLLKWTDIFYICSPRFDLCSFSLLMYAQFHKEYFAKKNTLLLKHTFISTIEKIWQYLIITLFHLINLRTSHSFR